MNIFNSNIVSDESLNKQRISEISGLSYYDNLISTEEEKYLLEYLSIIEYTKNVKYYGYNYTYKKKTANPLDKIIDIPKDLNIIFNKINISYNQLVVERIPINKKYSFPIHSDIFYNNIIILSMGGDYIINFENKINDKKIDILIKRRSILIITKECNNEWIFRINNKKQIFNNKYKKPKDIYTLTFKNIKLTKPDNNDDVYYFSY